MLLKQRDNLINKDQCCGKCWAHLSPDLVLIPSQLLTLHWRRAQSGLFHLPTAAGLMRDPCTPKPFTVTCSLCFQLLNAKEIVRGEKH